MIYQRSKRWYSILYTGMNKCMMGDIAHYIESSPSAVSQILTRLENGKYLKCYINVNNRREEQIDKLIIGKFNNKIPGEDLEQLRSLIFESKC